MSEHSSTTKTSEKQPDKAYLLASFDSEEMLVKAAGKIQESGFSKYDAHSSYPIHGLFEAMKLKDSPLGWLVVAASIFTILSFGGFMIWAALDYPIVHSGKPAATWETLILPTWEITVIVAGTVTLLGLLFLSGLPLLYHPLFKSNRFAEATSHGFFISVESTDPKFEKDGTRKMLEDLGGKNIEWIE